MLAAWAVPLAAVGLAAAGGGEPETRAAPAEAFLDSVGVQTHAAYYDTAYVDADRVAEAVAYLGVRHVRDGVRTGPSGERALRLLERLGRSGVRLNLGADVPLEASDRIGQALDIVRDRLLPYTASLEGPNEIDQIGGPAWVGRARNQQRDLYTRAKRDPRLRRLPVLGPSLADNRNQAALGDLRGIADWANLHTYPGGLPPSRPQLPAELAAARGALGDAPLVVSETGYHNALAQPGRQPPTSEAAAAAYLPRLFLHHFAAGVRRTYAYELLDERPEPARIDQERHFGLFRTDFTPKLAADGLRRLLTLVRGPAGVRDGPDAIDLDVPVARERLRHLVLRRADGRLLVLLWQPVSVWDRHARRPLMPPRVGAEIGLGATFGDVALHRVRAGGAPTRDLGAARSVRVEVAADEIVGLVLGPSPGGWPLPPLLPRVRPGRGRLPGRRAPHGDGDPERL